MRTPEDMVDDLLRKGTPWMGILAVASSARSGTWHEKVKKILLDRQLMPADADERNRIRDEYLAKTKKAQAEEETKRLAERKKARMAQIANKEAACQKDTSSSSSPQAKRKQSAKSSKTST